jgi:quinol monooxygenase YgiN
MLHILWEYRVEAAKRAAFEEHYAGNGSWALLFGKNPSYRGTLLVRDQADPGHYLTVDSWENEASFKDFKREFGREYEALDKRCEALTEEERCLGWFETVG